MGPLKTKWHRPRRTCSGLFAPCAGAVIGLACAMACGAPPHLPPPVYERPALPPWQPPAPEGEDPLDSLDDLEGEWVDEESPPADDAPSASEPPDPAEPDSAEPESEPPDPAEPHPAEPDSAEPGSGESGVEKRGLGTE